MLTDLRCVSRKVCAWGGTAPSAGKAVVVLQTELQEQKPNLGLRPECRAHTPHTRAHTW